MRFIKFFFIVLGFSFLQSCSNPSLYQSKHYVFGTIVDISIYGEDEKKAEKVTYMIRDQYSNLNDIYAARDTKYKEIKVANKDNKILQDTLIAQENRKVEAALAKLHQKYLNGLATQLNATQIETVKDGMTYGVVPLTYRAYQEQLLNLTAEQKKQIYVWLTEAREKAMDAESSDKKHAWFGKYKGRINNYLSVQGYDLKQEGI